MITKKKTRSSSEQIANTQKKIIQGVLFLIGFTLIFIFIFGNHGLFQLYKLEKEKKSVINYISNLRDEREKLKIEKNKLENDMKYLEKLARENYLMSKPGEKVFRVLSNLYL